MTKNHIIFWITAELEGQFAEGARLEQAIRESLEGIGVTLNPTPPEN